MGQPNEEKANTRSTYEKYGSNSAQSRHYLASWKSSAYGIKYLLREIIYLMFRMEKQTLRGRAKRKEYKLRLQPSSVLENDDTNLDVAKVL